MNESDPPKPKLRWYQFSLRTLLVFVLVAGVGFGWIGARLQRARNNRQARAMIRSLGGEPASPVCPCPSKSPSWLNGVLRDPGAVRCVDGHSKFGDAGLEYVKELPNLQLLDINGGRVTDAGLKHLEGLTSLQTLSLAHAQITDAGLVQLKGLNNLESLNLSGTQVTDAGLEHLRGLVTLETLWLSRTKVSDAGLVNLRRLTKLKHLGLSNTQVTDEGVAKLQEALPDCKIDH